MSRVRAVYLEASASYLGTGSEGPVSFTGYPDPDGWIDVGGFVRLTVQIEADDQNTTVTVEARVSPTAAAFDLIAPTAVTASTVSRVAEKENIEHVQAVRVLENGTAASDPHVAHLLAK